MEKVTIMDVAAEGKAIAKVNDLVIFVPYVVPGDVVDLQIKRKKNKYAEAEAVKFHELSPNRAVPFCQHYGVCRKELHDWAIVRGTIAQSCSSFLPALWCLRRL